MKLEEIKAGEQLRGVDPLEKVTVLTVPLGPDSVNLIYRIQDNRLRERMLFRSDEPRLHLVHEGQRWTFDGSSDSFKLVVEAFRINLAYLFDSMMAIHTSNVDPLPHQISAVYEVMLTKQPLRFVLADDPGAGKTIMPVFSSWSYC